MRAKWEVAKYKVEGLHALKLNVNRDPRYRMGTDEHGKEKFSLPIHEWSIPCRHGELFGLATAREVLPYRSCFIWQHKVANQVIAELGVNKKLRSEGEEVQFEVPPGMVSRVLALLEPVASVQIAKKIMNEIKGQFHRFAEFYDAEATLKAQGSTGPEDEEGRK